MVPHRRGVTGVNAIAYLSLNQVLTEWLGSTSRLFLTAGLVLAVLTVGLLVVTRSTKRPRVLPESLAAINVIWAGASFGVVLADPFGLTAIGLGWTTGQGVVVLAFAVLQIRALKSSPGHAEGRKH